MAYDKELRPDARVTPSPYHTSDGSMSPDRSGMSDDPSFPPSPHHHDGHDGKDHITMATGGSGQTQSLDRALRPTSAVSTATARQHSLGRNQPHHHHHRPQPLTGSANQNGARANIAKEANDHQIPPAPPPPPPLMPSVGQVVFPNSSGHSAAMATPLHPSAVPGNQGGATLSHPYSPSPPPPPPANYVPSPSRPSGQAPSSATAPPVSPAVDGRKPPSGPNVPMNDARSDLLAAIRRGIQLRKVQEQREQEEAKKREPTGNDVATILSRRIAVEYSESEEESEPEDQEWSD